MTDEVAQVEIVEEDRLRAQWYALLAQFLSAPPDAATLKLARALTGDATELGHGVTALAAAAKGATVVGLEEEYFNLFTGIGLSQPARQGDSPLSHQMQSSKKQILR